MRIFHFYVRRCCPAPISWKLILVFITKSFLRLNNIKEDISPDNIVVPIEEGNLDNDKPAHFEEKVEPEVAHEIVSEELDKEVW
jgi:hypothetical protein